MKRVSALGPLLESSLRRGKRLQSTATQEESSHPPPARELNFCTHFLVEESENLFGELLQEAVHKHNIHPYIAHQLPPVLQPDLVIDTYQRNCVPLHSTSSNAAAESSQILTDAFKKKLIGDDPVPPVYLNRKQKEWFSTVVTKKLLPYTPTHDPPPLRSTGNKFMSSNLYLEEGESKIRYYKNSDFNDFNLRLMAVNTHKKVPRNFITLAASDPTVLRSDRHVLSEAAVHAISNGIIRGQIANIHDCDYYCGACGKGFVRYETAQKHLMTRHHNLYLPQEMSLNRKGGTESGKEEAIEKAYLLPTGLLQVHYHLLKHEKAEGSMDRLPEENATTSTKQETTEAKEEPKTKVKLSAVASLATVKLPTESFIDEILISVWDEVAIDREDLFKDSKEKYFAFSDTVVEAASKSSLPDNTRKRTTMRDGDGSATAVKTTPDNVAPAIKNRRDHFDRQSPHTPAAARRSVKEKRKDYPNPFGEYGSGIVQEEVVELDREPVNPFVAWEAEAKLTASGDSGTQDGGQSNDNNNNHNNSSGKDGRNFFHCPFCDPTNAPRYRLLDNLLDHIDEAHPSLTLTSEEVKEKIYKQDRVSRMYEGYTRDEATKEEEVEPEKDTSTDEEEGSLTATEVSPTVPEETPVHNRVCFNMDVIGQVVDIQEGYVMEEEVLQLILRINEPDHGSQPDREEGEYITVRCMGASVPRALLRQQLVINSTVYVRGLLKMNRRQDVEMHKSETGDESSSKRMYAFPFIRVTPPFGCVQVLNNF